jgi:hypothetical protein
LKNGQFCTVVAAAAMPGFPKQFGRLAATAFAVALCAHVAAAEDAPDALLTTPVTPQILAQGAEADAYAQGVQAYVWGYPLVRMERVARQYTDVPQKNPPTSYRAPLNQIGWARELATAASKDMPTSNNDTFYMSAIVDLTEPFILSVPDTHDRYYVVDVFNMWQELEHYIGRRVTGTGPGNFALVPPGWKGELPAGVTRLDVATDKIWLWGRLRLSEGEDVAPVLALQNEFHLVPLSAYGKAEAKPQTPTLGALPDIAHDELGFFTQLGAAVRANPIRPADEALFAQFARIGLTKDGFDASKLDAARRKGLLSALQDGPSVAISAFQTAAVQRNGWSWATGLDRFGFDYPLRALVSGPYLGGQGEKEAMYPLRYTDSDGKVLTGAGDSAYTIKFAAPPPVDGFWSLTVYNAGDKLLVANPIARYKIGSDTKGLVTAADGSITLKLSHAAPAGEAAKNWLPTPYGPFYMILRLYQPQQNVLNGTYQLPQVVNNAPPPPATAK